MANVRIIEQPEITTLSGGEFLVTDSQAAGTKKITPANLVAAAGGSGVSDDLKTALLQLASKVAYIDDDGQEYYDDLYDALYDTTWQVTNNLSHCTSSNPAESVLKNGSYSATITANTGYTLTGATVTVMMGGNNITSTAYNNGTISIANVTGILSITVTAVALAVSSITAVYTQSGTVYPTDSLDSLKADLVVTATYSDTTTATVPSADYTLSGTLTAGTSAITVTYSEKTTTFNVTVTGWDFAWDFSMGKLEEQTGWTVDKSASGVSSTLDSVGEKIANSTTSAKYFQPYMSPDGSLASLRTMPTGYGVVEALVSTTEASTQNAGRLRVYAVKTSGVSIVVLVSDGKWKIRTSSTAADCPNIGDCSSGVDYLIRLVMKDTVADVYINGTLAAQNVDTSTMVSASSNGMILNPENNGKYVYIKAFRIRTGGV